MENDPIFPKDAKSHVANIQSAVLVVGIATFMGIQGVTANIGVRFLDTNLRSMVWVGLMWLAIAMFINLTTLMVAIYMWIAGTKVENAIFGHFAFSIITSANVFILAALVATIAAVAVD